MKKLFLSLLAVSVFLSMLTACSQSVSDSATDSINENEVTVSGTEQNSNPDLNTASSTAPVRRVETTAKTNPNKADNDVVFSNNETTTSSKKTETISSAVDTSQNLNETTVIKNSKTDKNKVTTDKDGWVDKWY
ncbi:hypothetical protein [Eubacterium sp.]